MKSKQLFLKTAIITSVFILTLNTSCKKDTVENPPDNIDTIAININETSIRPYQIVTVTITGTDLLYEDYNGIIGTEEIILKRASENELVLMVPNLSPGTYSLSLTFDNSNTASTNVVILENTTIDDYNLIISTVESEIINTLDYAQAIAAETGNSLANEEVDLLTNMINSFNDTYSQLNENEKLAYAHFINENPDLFEPGDKNKVKSDNQAVINYKEFLLKKVFTIGTSGTVLGLSITAPSPDILTKIIAITAAIILVRELKAVAYKTIEFYDIAHIPFISSLVGSSKNTDFIFTNDNEYTFDINVNLRSVYNADIGTNNSTLSSIILHLDTFQYWWGKIDGFILTIKNVFGFSGGGLTGRPQTISDISTYNTLQKIGNVTNASIVGISNSNVILSTNNSDNQLNLTFSTSQSTNQNFDFIFVYNENSYTLEKSYSAILVAENPVIQSISFSNYHNNPCPTHNTSTVAKNTVYFKDGIIPSSGRIEFKTEWDNENNGSFEGSTEWHSINIAAITNNNVCSFDCDFCWGGATTVLRQNVRYVSDGGYTSNIVKKIVPRP